MKRNQRMTGTFPSETMLADGLPIARSCCFCGEVKPISEFARNGTDEDGVPEYRHDCKVCYNIRRRENATKSTHSGFIAGQRRRGEVHPELTHQEWKESVIFFGGECAYCGATPRKGQRLTKDHLEPISKGGTTTEDNIVPACPHCNSSKGAEDFKDWFMKQEFFSQERLNRIFKWRTIMRLVGPNKEE